MSLEKEQALTIFFSNNKLQQNEKLMSQVYEECKDQDGFLYCKYASYEVYGNYSNWLRQAISSGSISHLLEA